MSHKPVKVEDKAVQCELEQDLKTVIEFMKTCYTSPSPPLESLRECMAATFDYRRHFITYQSPEVVEIQNQYPALFNFSEIKREFKRITIRHVFKNFGESLESYHEAVLKHSPSSKEKKLVDSQLHMYKDDREHLQYVKTAGTLLLIPSFFDVPLHHFMIFNDRVPDSTSTKIVCNSSFDNCLAKDSVFEVHAEKLKVCDTNDLRSAFFALCAAYYVFNIEYPSQCIDVMTILEKLFLKITPEIFIIPGRVKQVESLLTGS